jgi:hypothetical protein
MRWAALVARMGDMRNACRVLGGKPVGNKTLGRSKLRWDGITKMDLSEIRDW